MAIVSALKTIIKQSHKNNVPDFRSFWNGLMMALKAETGSL